MANGVTNNNTEEETTLQEEPEEPTSEPTDEPAAAPTIEPTPKPPRATPTPEEVDNCYTGDIGFTIELPETWICLNLTETNFEKIFSVAFETNPELSESFPIEFLTNMAELGMKLYAIIFDNPSSYKGLYATLNIIVADMPFGLSFDDLVDLNIQQISDLFGGDVTITDEKVSIGELDAVKLTFFSKINDLFGNPQELSYMQFLIIKNQTQYILTFVAPKADFQVLEPLFIDTAQTFKITDYPFSSP